MHDQPRYEPLEQSDFFETGGSASRLPVEGTVARGQLREDDHLYLGKVDGRLVDRMPFAVTPDLLQRGRERYEIYCTPCHGQTGYGDGIVVLRGLRAPPSLHEARLRGEPVGHFYDVMTNGIGAMYSYASRIKPHDRWAIVAYVRALQLSQNAASGDLPEAERQRLEGAGR